MMMWYTVQQAAHTLGISVDTIRLWRKKSLVKPYKTPTGEVLYDLEALRRLQAQQSGVVQGAFQVLRSEPIPYRVIELFSGAGGMALGFENAGLQDALLVEYDRDAAATLRLNRPHWNVQQADIRDVDFKPYADQVEIVAGGFPCQAFSYAGKKLGFEDIRGTLFFEFARCVAEVRPKIALAENVRGLLQHDKGRTLATMLAVLDELGYDVEYRVLQSQFFDVPQKRDRLIMIGVRRDAHLPILFPAERSYTVTVRQALEACPPSEGARYPQRKHDILAQVPEGGNWRDLSPELQAAYMQGSLHLEGGKTGMARRLAWDEPSLTLTCSPAQKQTERCHPEETRPLTVREYARIQSFPDDWTFTGSLASRYKQIGNAVPVNLAYHVGRALIAMLERAGQGDEDGLASSAMPLSELPISPVK